MEVQCIIYVLRLVGNKYYIGKTHDLFRSIRNHIKGCESEWTVKYKPVFIQNTIKRASKINEDDYVKDYMIKYGIDNVRGGSYTTLILSEEQIENLYFSDSELCLLNPQRLMIFKNPVKIKRPWTLEEDNYLRLHCNQGMHINELSLTLNRSQDDINLRLYTLYNIL